MSHILVIILLKQIKVIHIKTVIYCLCKKCVLRKAHVSYHC